MAMATGDNQIILGSNNFKNASVFVGGNSDDGVQIDAFAAARVAANDDTGTFTALINVQDIAGDYAFIGCGDASAVQYFYASITAGEVHIKAAVAGPDVNFDMVSVGSGITPHNWFHVAIVQDAVKPKVYVNGVLQTMTETDVTESDKWFNFWSLIDGGHIGCADSIAGGAALTLEFKGAVGKVKYWDTALSDNQVLQDFNEITNTTNLISEWDMVDDLIDSVSGHDGTPVGDTFLTNGYSEITSRLKVAGVVVADDTTLVAQDGAIIGALIIKA